jgi:hypothetical protein
MLCTRREIRIVIPTIDLRHQPFSKRRIKALQDDESKPIRVRKACSRSTIELHHCGKQIIAHSHSAHEITKSITAPLSTVVMIGCSDMLLFLSDCDGNRCLNPKAFGRTIHRDAVVVPAQQADFGFVLKLIPTSPV